MMRRAERPCPKAAVRRVKAAPSHQRANTDLASACEPGLVLVVQRLAGNRATTQLIGSGPPTSDRTSVFEALRAAGRPRDGVSISDPDDRFERESELAADRVVGVRRSCEHGRARARVEPAGRAVQPVMLQRMVDEPGPSEGGPGAGEQAGLAAGFQVWPSGRTSEAIDQIESLLLRQGPGASAIVVTTSAHPGDPTRRSWARNQNGKLVWSDKHSGAEVTAPREATWGASLIMQADGTIVSSADGATPRVSEAQAEEAMGRAAQSNKQELDHEYGQLLGPKDRDQPKDTEFANGELRLNPMWYRLEDFPPKLVSERKSATWLYTVRAGGEISIGVEHPGRVVEPQEWEKLLDGMRQNDPALTESDLKSSLDDKGHPTIAAAFDPLGKTSFGPARVSGELKWEKGQLVVTDKSGRYMSPKVRGKVTAEQVDRWLVNVARRMSERFGVPVHPMRVKTP